MKLDKTHLDQFENISPPLRHALTVPVETDKPLANVAVYVAGTAFDTRTTRQDVLDVAVALRVVTGDDIQALRDGAELLRNVPGGHQHICDLLDNLARGDA